VVKVDARHAVHDGLALHLLRRCAEQNVRVIFKRVENTDAVDALARLAALSGQEIHAQGFLWDLPQASLLGATLHTQVLPQSARAAVA
jgi:hypothetical protein